MFPSEDSIDSLIEQQEFFELIELRKKGSPWYALKNKFGLTVLNKAVISGNSSVVKTLLEMGAVPIKNELIDGTTFFPLHYSIMAKNNKTTELLLSAGCSPNYENEYGQSPLSVSCYYRDPLATNLLVENFATLNPPYYQTSKKPEDIKKIHPYNIVLDWLSNEKITDNEFLVIRKILELGGKPYHLVPENKISCMVDNLREHHKEELSNLECASSIIDFIEKIIVSHECRKEKKTAVGNILAPGLGFSMLSTGGLVRKFLESEKPKKTDKNLRY